ncbi:unnamed protein product [Darwinula stevensoni]|uniref:Uncharacterized protein n=1 Tax=Darwinula stevensoni TaxID=69355 RepID=A0A7R9A9I6_9CRUS|nr:unnamed protein product [Darwinula stevensoni]CAG0897231.1 unnamed protein product [Darwinula stevensoni]
MTGSWFIQSLCEVLLDHSDEEDLLSMMTEVARRVAFDFESNLPDRAGMHRKKQVPFLTSTLTRRVFFIPREEESLRRTIRSDCLTVVFISHAINGWLYAHGQAFSPCFLLTPFNDYRCLSLAGKPKIFIFQLEFEDFGHSAAIPVKRIYGKNKMMASVIKDYMKTRRLQEFVQRTHQIPLRMIRQSCAAARSFSTEAKDVLKKQILWEGQDMGCLTSDSRRIYARDREIRCKLLETAYQEMRVIYEHMILQIHAYSYEVVAGQHIVQARKELLEETPTGKDTCTCAVYVGVTEAEKRMLALHNAKLQAVPYNVLDVLQKYHEMQEAATDGEIPKEYTDTLKEKRQVINNLLRMGPPVVKVFLMMGKRLEDADPGCVSKKLYHLRHLGNPSISSNDFLESLKVVNCAGDMKKLGNNLEDVIRKKTLRTSFSKLAGIREEEMDHRYPQHVTDEALKPFMRLKNPEKEKEWKGYVELCIGRQVTQNTEELGANSEIITVLGSHLESLGEAEKCLLGLHDHQGRFHGDKNIPTAFMVDDIKQAAAIQESLRSHCLKTGIAIIDKAESEGELFAQHHAYAVVASTRKIPLATTVLSRKEFLTSIGQLNGWLLSNIRGLKKRELPSPLKLLSPVPVELEAPVEGISSERMDEADLGSDNDITQTNAVIVPRQQLSESIVAGFCDDIELDLQG